METSRLPPGSPTKPSSRSFSSNFPSRPLQNRDLNAMNASFAKHKDASMLDASALDTPPPSSPTAEHSEEASGGVFRPFGRQERSSSITLPYSSSPPRDIQSSPTPAGASPVKAAARQSRPSLPAAPIALNSKASKTDPHAGLHEITQEGDSASHILYGSYTHSLMLGRCKPSGQARDSQSNSQEDQEMSTSEDSPLASKLVQHVPLPNNARHVSRRHAIIEWLPFSPSTSANQAKRPLVGGFVVRILGQNGLIVEGKRRREGHVLRLQPGNSTIDFFGVKTRFEVHPQAQKPISVIEAEAEAVHRHQDHHSKRPRSSLPSVNGSSPSKRRSDVSRTPSLSGSAKSVAQLLSGSKHAKYVRTSTLTHDSELPPSPPTSSPTRGGFQAHKRTADPMHPRSDGSDDMPFVDDGPEEPASPTLGRGGRVMQLPMLPQLTDTPATRQPETRGTLDSGARLQALSDLPSADVDSDSPLAQQKLENSVERRSSFGSLSDAESELTPSPTPSPKAQPQRLASQPSADNSKPLSPSVGRPLTLTNSQVSMPPPKLPASRSLSGPTAQGVSNGIKDAESLRNALRDRARGCVARIAPTYDLEGLLAGAIVFHRTATISASEAVRSVLAGTQGMMRGEVGTIKPSDRALDAEPLQPGTIVPGWDAEDLLVKQFGLNRSQASERWSSVARRAWTEQLEIQLQSKPMFGQIQRAGKDASGNSLEHWYYYSKEGDEDVERAANLGALAKPIRGALKTHKPIFWKKSAYPRSADEEAQAYNSVTDSTAARVYASAWKDDREWDLFTDSQISPAIVSTAPSSSMAKKIEKKEQQRMGIDEKRIWEETQPEEREKTWDRVGDMDWSSSRSSPMPSGSQNVGKRRKRVAASLPRED
ncbi:unnamed protein product [Sympodiomycopsis kandeliae]